MDLTLGIYRISSQSDPRAGFPPPSHSIMHRCIFSLPGAALGVSAGAPAPGWGAAPDSRDGAEGLCHPSAAEAENHLICRTRGGRQ